MWKIPTTLWFLRGCLVLGDGIILLVCIYSLNDFDFTHGQKTSLHADERKKVPGGCRRFFADEFRRRLGGAVKALAVKDLW